MLIYFFLELGATDNTSELHVLFNFSPMESILSPETEAGLREMLWDRGGHFPMTRLVLLGKS